MKAVIEEEGEEEELDYKRASPGPVIVVVETDEGGDHGEGEGEKEREGEGEKGNGEGEKGNGAGSVGSKGSVRGKTRRKGLPGDMRKLVSSFQKMEGKGDGQGDADGEGSDSERVKGDGGQGKVGSSGFSPENRQEDELEEKNGDGNVTGILAVSGKDSLANTGLMPGLGVSSSIVESYCGANSKGEIFGDDQSHHPVPNATQKTHKDVSKAKNFQWSKVTALTLPVKLILADFEPHEYYNAADVAVALDEMTESVSSYLIKSSSNNFSLQQKDEAYINLIDTFS